MRVEWPEFTRCCFCVPLRRGIIAWAYANLALQAVLLYVGVHILLIMIVLVDYVGVVNVIMEIFGFLLVLLSTVYSIVILVACHKKSAKLLRISYIYGMVDVIFSIIFNVSAICREVQYINFRGNALVGDSRKNSITLELALVLAAYFLQTFLQGYMILLLRSEMIKLQEQSLEIEFVNNAAESEARCIRAHRSASNNDNDNEAQRDSVQGGTDGNNCDAAQIQKI